MTRPLYVSEPPKRPVTYAEPMSAEEYQRIVEISRWNAQVQQRKDEKKPSTGTTP